MHDIVCVVSQSQSHGGTEGYRNVLYWKVYSFFFFYQSQNAINDEGYGMLQVKRYYQFKQKHSNLYDGLVPSKNKNIFDHNILTVLPNRDQFGRRILILELGSKFLVNEQNL